MGAQAVGALRRTAVYMKTIAAVSSPAPFALQGDTCKRSISMPATAACWRAMNIPLRIRWNPGGSWPSVWCVALSAPTSR